MIEEWFTESPGHPITIGILLTAFAAMIWFMVRKRILLFLAVLMAIATIAIIVVERAIVTDREQITETIFDLADYVADGDADSVISHVAEKPNFIARIRHEMKRYDINTCRLLDFNEKSVEGNPVNKAFFDFVVYANGTNVAAGFGRQASVRVALEFEKQGDEWKIVAYDYIPAPQNRNWNMKR